MQQDTKDTVGAGGTDGERRPGERLPVLSVILPTDGPDTVRGVLNHLRKQTLAANIEVVLATPATDQFDTYQLALADFGWANIVEVPNLKSLGAARARALEAARAPYAFLGETHSFARAPDWAERLLARHAEGWAVVVPGFHNANPAHLLSWAGFLLDYGGWMHDRPAGEIDYWPLNNSSCARSTILGATADPAHALSYGDQLIRALAAAGHRVYFEPAAALSHLNITRWKAWVDEHFIGGHLVAAYRSREWPLLRRWAYAAAAPAIALVLFARVWRPAWQASRRNGLPLTVLPTMLAGTVLKAVGEALGYLRLGRLEASERRMTEYELHKQSYA
jgi:hypothetical protein